jgi:hypothetical protein
MDNMRRLVDSSSTQKEIYDDDYENRLSNFQKAVGKRMQVLIGLSLPSFGETMMTIQSDRKDGM